MRHNLKFTSSSFATRLGTGPVMSFSLFALLPVFFHGKSLCFLAEDQQRRHFLPTPQLPELMRPQVDTKAESWAGCRPQCLWGRSHSPASSCRISFGFWIVWQTPCLWVNWNKFLPSCTHELWLLKGVCVCVWECVFPWATFSSAYQKACWESNLGWSHTKLVPFLLY